MQLRTLFVFVGFLLATTGLLPCLVNHILFPVFLIEKENSCASSPRTIFANCLWDGFSNSIYVCTCTLFGYVSIYAISIWQKYFVPSKYASKWNESALVMCLQFKHNLETCICHHLQIFETCALPVTVTGRPDFAVSLMDSVQVRYFFLPLTICYVL